MKFVSAETATSAIRSNHSVFIHGGAATPQHLITAMVNRAPEVCDVKIIQLHTEGDAEYAKPEYRENFRTLSLFVSANLRKAVASGEADYVPVFLSEVPALFRKRILPLDIALIHVSPPDQHGFCSLGTSVDVARSAVEMAATVIAQVNSRMPRTHGDGQIHVDRIAMGVEIDEPLFEHKPGRLTDADRAIAGHVAGLVEDGATLQMGIGAIPDAVLVALDSHKDLGIHSEMFSDGVIDLVERGVVNGRLKRTHPGKVVGGFTMGTRRLYDFVNDNPQIALLDITYVNDTAVIRRNPRVTAINSAIEVDMTGQVCADSIGSYEFSGVGGQMDFIRGASLSEGGKPIIALPSVTSRGESRIVAYLKEGAGVVTTRAHVHYIVTEYGVAYLYGKGLRERARSLIQIAHPDHREALERAAHQRFKTSL
jgi:4-hydroxybutyrate CoA-transferase